MVVGIGLAMVLVGSLFFAAPASAYVNSNWFEELPTTDQHAITDFIYEQSPQGTIPWGGEASEISESISHAYESEAPAQPVYPEVAGWANTLEEDVNLIPELDEEEPELVPVDGTFYVGWKIGEGVDAIFAKIGLGPDAAPEENFLGSEGYEFCYSAECGAKLEWRPYGGEVYFGATVQQKPGAYLYDAECEWYERSHRCGYFAPVQWDESPCPFSDFTPPPYSHLEVIEYGTCREGRQEFTQYIVYPYVTVRQLLSKEGFHHYDPLLDPTPTLVSEAPADPGTAVVGEKSAEVLDESEFGQAFLTQTEQNAGKAEPDYEYLPAPAATEKKVDDEERRCDRGSGPTFTNLGGSKSPEPFATFEPTPFSVTDLPEGVESPSPVYLRWGEAEWQGEQRKEPQNMDAWGGWGYRHIRAKHGWSGLDRIETEEALARPQVPIQEGTKWLYTAIDPAAGLEGVECERQVYVQFQAGINPKSEKEDPAPRGIVTSYNIVK